MANLNEIFNSGSTTSPVVYGNVAMAQKPGRVVARMITTEELKDYCENWCNEGVAIKPAKCQMTKCPLYRHRRWR